MKLRALTLGFLLTGAMIVGASFVTVPHASAAGTCTQHVYGQGNAGTCVKYIQKLVNYHNKGGAYTYPAVTADGIFGPKTKGAVLNVQKIYGLSRDGIVGPQTWRIICSPQMGPGIPSSFPLAEARAAGCNI